MVARIIITAAVLVAILAASARAACVVAGYDLSQVPVTPLQINQQYNGGNTTYTYTIDLCAAVNTPPASQPPCTVPGYISEYSSSHCETAWNAMTGSTAGTQSLTVNFGQAGSANHLMWTATVTVNCGSTLAFTPVGSVVVTGASTDALNFAFTLTSSAVCGCVVAGYDLSQVPVTPLQIKQQYNGGNTMYTWIIDLCAAVSTPPASQPPCTVPGYISEYSSSHCETAWNAMTGSTAGTQSLTANFGQAGSANHLMWTATVTVNCGSTLAFTPVGNVVVTGASTDALNFAITLTSTAVCGSGPTVGPTPPPELTGLFATVLQDPVTSAASVVVLNSNGSVISTSNLQWAFRWPLVEVSVDTNTQLIHIITYPESIGNATLYKLAYDLTLVSTEISSGLSYFDLEFSATRNMFFGIAVTSPFGRELSRFADFTVPVEYTPITR
ncbi:membrane-associated protein, putative, partial [Bodo saltans]